MNIILIDPTEMTDAGTVTLLGNRLRHIRKILRSKVGDSVRVGLINGPMGHGIVRELNREQATLAVTATIAPPPKKPIDLVLALPRPIMLKRILAQATSFGVSRIFLINAKRVEKSFFNASLLEKENLEGCLRLGLEQAVDTMLPELSIHHRFRPFVEDVLPTIAAACPVRLVAHPDTDLNLHQAAPGISGERTLLAIGPEGGWIDFEIEKFQEQGLTPFTLGSRILRMDTAVPALLAQIDLLGNLPPQI
ncbi:MAG: 16S rRNA (uracil(1498)-N(3))-methyltransferase [Desulfobulbaceae bacterium]|nr:16S rRNA (uracil(1498)-N(3))-methyltransferase [Desulfobulbaceae bacterium]